MGCAPVARDHFETAAALGEANVAGVDDHVDAFGLQDLLDGGRDILVLAGRQPRPLLDDRHVSAEPAVHLRELQCDVAAADDDQMLWHSVEFEDADIRHVVDVGEPRHIGRHRPAADVEEDLVRLEYAVVHADGVRAFEAGMAADERAPVHAVEPGLDALAVVAHDLVLARLDRGHLDTDFACADAVFGRRGARRGRRAHWRPVSWWECSRS